jgi:outer membrane receptor for monomeric catechols
MKHQPLPTSRAHAATLLACALAFVPLAGPLRSQTAPNSNTIGTAAASAEAPVELSPFTVSTSKDTGYLASGTLAGSRLNTSLVDTPASISVMTRDFINDIAATNVGDALAYALNAERDTSESTGNGHGSGDLPISIRGFGGSSLGRNYFQWGLESDTYNTERLHPLRHRWSRWHHQYHDEARDLRARSPTTWFARGFR